MLTIEGYKFIEELSATSPHTRISRFARLVDNKKVIMKLPRNDHPTNREITNLEHEYYLLRQLHSSGIIQAYDLISPQLTPILILEDSGGQPLSIFLKGRPLGLEQFFHIALQLTDILNTLYQQHIIHKDIKPANIIINPDTLTIKLADFSISSQLSEEIQEQMPPDLLEGTLAYMSPEQTGRMNRPIDYRTDYYSLGVTFFEMLTGVLPFQSTDPLELAYAHIAKMPPAVSDLNPKIPTKVSAIIAKLLSKAPEDRYTHVLRLKSDLETCAKQWMTKHKIDDFDLGQHDIQDKLQLSHKLYGREEQVNTLLTAFDQVNHGPSQLILITGYAGIGKTSLVNEIHKPITQRSGYFTSGKFDQLKRRPYSAIVEAFQNIVKQILAEPEVKLNQFKQYLLTALGENAQVVIDVIPEVELIIGAQPAVPALNPVEAQNRFNFMLQNFVQVFAAAEHPLVVFLDDLQWADSASLKFMENLLSDPTMRYLLLIGAYRDNEVDATHPLLATLQQLQEAEISYQTVTLKSLQQTDIKQLLADVFTHAAGAIAPFAKLLLDKTQGNPFFINEFLKTLYHEKLIYFSYDINKWLWDIEKIQQQNITDNVVDLLVTKIQRLSETSQQMLKLAACIGHIFDLQTLAIIGEKTFEQIAVHLNEAQQTNLIVPLGDTYKTAVLLEGDLAVSTILTEHKLTYRFAHDRIQQAAYSLIPIEARQQTHLKIGQLLLKEHPLEEQDERLFDLLEHLNQGLSLITEPTEKEHLARYNLWAGNKAMASTAYQAGAAYFETGISLLGIDAWEKNYEMALALHQGQLQCLYLLGDFDSSERIFITAERHAKTKLQKAETYLIKIHAYAVINEHQQVFEICAKTLKLFGVNITIKISRVKVLLEMVKIHYHIGKRPIAELDQELQPAHDPEIIMLQKLYSNIIGAAYLLGNDYLYGYTVCRIINISLTHGYTEETPFALLTYSVLLSEKFNKFTEAFAFATLSRKLETKIYSPTITAKTLFLRGYFINTWQHHLKDSIALLKESFELCMDTGNLEYAGYCMIRNAIQYNIGGNLAELSIECDKAMGFLKHLKNESWYYIIAFLRLVVNQLQNKLSTPDEFELVINEVLKHGSLLGLSSYIRYAQLLFIVEDYVGALKWSTAFYNKKENTRGMVVSLSVGLLFYALSIAKHYPTATFWEKRRYWRILLSIQKKFKRCEKIIPINLRFMYLLISAEMLNIRNTKLFRVPQLYDEAITVATNYGYINHVALINECAARFYLRLNWLSGAKLHIQQAYYAYQRWGATYKCQLLAEQYPEWISALSSDVSTAGTTSTSTSGTFSLHDFDFMTIIKASQTIAREIQLSKLLEKLLQICFENAGAQKGALFFEQRGNIFMVAEGSSEQPIRVNVHGIPVEMNKIVPESVITYVQRTHENLLLNDENEINKFQQDTYIQANKPKSLLCIPIMQQNRVVGYLYLENRLTPHAFTAERLKVLLLLGGQTAISLENAKLYAASSRFVPYEFLRQIQSAEFG